jgi:NADPH:quinone reductase
MTRPVLIHTADGPGAIAAGERGVREPPIGEVLIRVHPAAVNRAGVVMWRTLGGSSVPVPFTPGTDAAGEAEVAGSYVTHVEAGQRVMAAVFHGGRRSSAQGAAGRRYASRTGRARPGAPKGKTGDRRTRDRSR